MASQNRIENGFEKGRRHVGETVKALAPAKVNLHLEVLRLRHDGYHDIETIFQAIKIFDELTVTLVEAYPGGEPKISLTVNGASSLAVDETNLCWLAARHFCRETSVSGKINIELKKNIPIAAGLGGGSSDAAAVLKACNHLFATRLDDGQLEEMGAALGADVPFFIKGGTAMGRGIGTILTPLPALRSGQFLIVKPHLRLQTNEVYPELKMGLTVNAPKANIGVIKSMLARFPQENWPGFNRLEEAVLPSQPAVQRIVRRLQELAPVAMLTGSGPTAFAAFADEENLDEFVAEFEAAGLYVKVVKPHPNGAQLEGVRR
ncbi:MAG: 4-diphosphocytidyl-2-C-methyl-D-erythritol kinase [Candidatus Krumholzibacteriia bacterium]|jgi:4-diphosphocytidyl-2-C-methyl-D-erythritol kinase